MSVECGENSPSEREGCPFGTRKSPLKAGKMCARQPEKQLGTQVFLSGTQAEQLGT